MSRPISKRPKLKVIHLHVKHIASVPLTRALSKKNKKQALYAISIERNKHLQFATY